MRLGHDDLTGGEDLLDDAAVPLAQSGAKKRALPAPNELLGCTAQRACGQGVDVQEVFLAVDHEDHVRKHLDHRTQRAIGLCEVLGQIMNSGHVSP